jgi:hypothetical protein
MMTLERCLRCAAPMEWRHQTWQCPRCRFKLGCCEGQLGECESGYAIAGGVSSSSTQSRVRTSQNARPA